MILSYLIPEDHYSFFHQVVQKLEASGIVVHINDVSNETDLILAGILPVTQQWISVLQSSSKPFILWNWDLYSFVNFSQPRWQGFLSLLPQATDVWSCSYETARQLKEVLGLDSFIMPAWIDPNELPSDCDRGDYALYASSNASLGKRLEWAESACELDGIPLKLLRGQLMPRADYVKLVAGCRVYLMTAFEESNGTIPAMEAGACGRPVVLADLPSSREVFGEKTPGVYYFRNWDFGDLRRSLAAAWGASSNTYLELSQRLVSCFSLDNVSIRMVRRLEEIHERNERNQT